MEEDRPSERRLYPYSIITEEGERWAKCNCCHFKSRLPRLIRAHIRNKHVKRKEIKNWYNCEECSYRSAKKYPLERHVSVMHTDPDDIKWMTCDKCPRFRTIHKQVFSRHMKDKHTPPEEIKWLDCPHCSYKAKHKYNQREHHANKHKTEKRTNCEYCQEVKGKVFAVILPMKPPPAPQRTAPRRSGLRKRPYE